MAKIMDKIRKTLKSVKISKWCQNNNKLLTKT